MFLMARFLTIILISKLTYSTAYIMFSFRCLIGVSHLTCPLWTLGLPGGSDGKEFACNAGDLGLIPGLGRSPRGGHGNPLQYSCLENSRENFLPSWHWQHLSQWKVLDSDYYSHPNFLFPSIRGFSIFTGDLHVACHGCKPRIAILC